MNIEQYYIKQLVKKNKVNFKKDDKLEREIERYKELFKKVKLYVRLEYEKEPKYYLQNKIKKDSTDIQENLREEINKLNYLYEDNFYFLNINKNVLKKKNNKHVYNIFKVVVVEFRKLNLFDDIIEENDYMVGNMFKPITLANLNNKNKLKLFEIIEKSINLKELYTGKDKKNNNIKYHNKFIFYLREKIYDFFIDLYNKNKLKKELKKELLSLDNTYSNSTHIPIFEILKRKNIEKNEQKIKKIINLIIDLDWSLEMNFLNQDYLIEQANKESDF